jgi:hypothetical protein
MALMSGHHIDFVALDRIASVNPSGPLALPPIRDYNGRHAFRCFPDLLA